VCFRPSGNHHPHFVHPEKDEFSNHHYSISSQHSSSSRPDIPSERNSTSISASKIKWFDAVRTVKQLNQVRTCFFFVSRFLSMIGMIHTQLCQYDLLVDVSFDGTRMYMI
jgi:hypothetical protein